MGRDHGCFCSPRLILAPRPLSLGPLGRKPSGNRDFVPKWSFVLNQVCHCRLSMRLPALSEPGFALPPCASNQKWKIRPFLMRFQKPPLIPSQTFDEE